MRPRVIVGIDPGTTTAWAILSLDGRILSIGSSKNVGLGRLISTVNSVGRPLIVGCDKRKTPGFVDQFGRKCGSRIVSPREDLKVELKRDLTRGGAASNAHELDALASARFAQRHVSPLLKKIHHFLEREAPFPHFAFHPDELFEIVYANGINISDAIDLFNEEEEARREGTGAATTIHPTNPLIASQTSAESTSHTPINHSRPRLKTILSMLQASKRENAILRERQGVLREELHRKDKRIAELERRLENRPTAAGQFAAAIDHKEHDISRLSGRLIAAAGEQERLKKMIRQLTRAILSPDEHIIAHVIADLGRGSVDSLTQRHALTTSSILFVRHTTHTSPSVLDDLARIQPLILTDERIKSHPLPVVRVKGIPRTMLDTIALFPSIAVQQAVRRDTMLHRVVSEYKKERDMTMDGGIQASEKNIS